MMDYVDKNSIRIAIFKLANGSIVVLNMEIFYYIAQLLTALEKLWCQYNFPFLNQCYCCMTYYTVKLFISEVSLPNDLVGSVCDFKHGHKVSWCNVILFAAQVTLE